jgi:hypothetical protein
MKKYILLWSSTLVMMFGCTQSSDLNLEGKLYMKGSSVNTYLVIEDKKSHKSYKIQNASHFDLIEKQKQRVKLRVKLIKKATGPGSPAVVEVLEVK